MPVPGGKLPGMGTRYQVASRSGRDRRFIPLLLLSLWGLAACGSDSGAAPHDAGTTPDAAALRDVALPDAALADATLSDAAPPEAPPVTVGVIADLNGSYGSTTYGSAVHGAVAALVAAAPDLVLSAGDMVAGQQSGLDYEAMWLAFHAAVTDPITAAGIPLAVTPGNHDASAYAGFTAERAEYEQQWLAHLPGVIFVDAAGYPFRYAFTVGPVLFVALDATKVGLLAAEQRAWLNAVLTQHGPHYEATVVFGHLPLYAVAVGRESETLHDAELEGLLEAHGVALYISGHHHAYYPGRRATVRHLAMGCLGAGPRALVGTSETAAKSLVLFTIHRGAITRLEAYPAPDFAAPIGRDTLPTALGVGADVYTRDDL